MKQKRELPETATLTDMMSVCDDLAAQGYLVHIEYHQAQKKITVYGDEVPDYVKNMKEQYAIHAAHPPAPQGKKWEEYEKLMQGLERELIEAGVQL